MRCLLVDDSPHFLAAARGLLEREGFLVVGAVSTSADALREVEVLRPDVTLVDIDLGGESGFDLARALSQRAGPMPVILISTHAEDDYASLIAASPAVGFMSKADLSARTVRELVDGHGNHGTSAAGVTEPRGT